MTGGRAIGRAVLGVLTVSAGTRGCGSGLGVSSAALIGTAGGRNTAAGTGTITGGSVTPGERGGAADTTGAGEGGAGEDDVGATNSKATVRSSRGSGSGGLWTPVSTTAQIATCNSVAAPAEVANWRLARAPSGHRTAWVARTGTTHVAVVFVGFMVGPSQASILRPTCRVVAWLGRTGTDYRRGGGDECCVTGQSVIDTNRPDTVTIVASKEAIPGCCA
jgi:hypothetical protein